jgi:hypothetical protein
MTWAVLLERAANQAATECGTRVRHHPGWRTRSHGAVHGPQAVMWHDTITPPSWASLSLSRLLADGYVGLKGPIANVQLDRDGTLVLIAAGRAHHAGAGSWPGISSGNAQTVGLEVANGGRPEQWTDAQRRVAAAFTRAVGVTAVGHKEWAPSRKQDPWSVDMVAARRSLSLRPPPVVPPPSDWFDMATEAELERVVERVVRRETGPALLAQTVEGTGGRSVGWLFRNWQRLWELLAGGKLEVNVDVDTLATQLREGLGAEVAAELGKRLVR